MVIITPSAQAVQISPETNGIPDNTTLGINTAEYNIAVVVPNTNLPPYEQFKLGDVIELISCNVSFKFLKSADYEDLEDPVDPSYTLVNSTPPPKIDERNIEVHTPNANRWKMTVDVVANCKKMRLIPNSEPPHYEEVTGTIEARGTGTAWFEAIPLNSDVLISLAPVIVREAKNAPTKRKIYEGTVSFVGACPPPTLTIDLEVQEPVDGGGVVLLATDENGGWSDTITLDIVAGEATTFYAYGDTESKNMDDVTITALYQGNSSSTELGETNVTVLWVNIFPPSDSDDSHPENDKRDALKSINADLDANGNIDISKNYALGPRNIFQDEGKIFYAHVFEVSGEVVADGFKDDIILVRDIETYAESKDIIAALTLNTPEKLAEFTGRVNALDDVLKILRKEHVKTQFASAIPGELPVNDTSLDDYLDKEPKWIFDIDGPCFHPFTEESLFHVSVDNFREFSVYDGTRCSDVLEFYVTHICFKIEGQECQHVKIWKSDIQAGSKIPTRSQGG